MSHPAPKFKVGDFVSCRYDFLAFYGYFYDTDHEDRLAGYYGIIVDVVEEHWDFIDEYIYEIICLDGERRYFMESEMNLAAFVDKSI
tara:strand:- start:62 stop:322 length:261 start_codon:yes stop_codon:yes gene_type:complete